MIAVPMGFNLLQVLFDNQKPQQILVKKSTLADFFAVADSNPEQRFELIDGQIIAMSNASIAHNTIITNLVILLGGQLIVGGSPCRIYAEANCKINDENCFQPDFAVVCHPPNSQRHLENPLIVGEVLSSNRRDDLDKKLPLYQATSSIAEIFYVEQERMEVAVYRRSGERWQKTLLKKGDTVRFESLDWAMPIEQFYRDVLG